MPSLPTPLPPRKGGRRFKFLEDEERENSRPRMNANGRSLFTITGRGSTAVKTSGALNTAWLWISWGLRWLLGSWSDGAKATAHSC